MYYAISPVCAAVRRYPITGVPFEEPIVPKMNLTDAQIHTEIKRRIRLDLPLSDQDLNQHLALPTVHPLDQEARNWDIEAPGHSGYAAYVRRVIDQARREFWLADESERDEALEHGCAHT